MEYEEKVSSLKKGLTFYQNLFVGREEKLLLVAAMGNRLKFNQLDTIFSPLRHAISQEEFIQNTIFVVNVTEFNCLEEDSEIPHLLVRGPQKLMRFDQDNSFYDAYQDLLKPLEAVNFPLFQESTIAVRGEWEKPSQDLERDHAHHTSAAAAVLSGFLIKLQNSFPDLTAHELKEGVLNSAEKDFNIPQSAYAEYKTAYQRDALEETVDPARNELDFWYNVFHRNDASEKDVNVPIYQALQEVEAFANENKFKFMQKADLRSFYGQGLFNAQRAFQYAGLLNQCRKKKMLNQDEGDFCSAHLLQERQKIFHKMIGKKN